MSHDTKLDEARASLRQALDLIQQEMQSYPTPISGCDAQYNHLLGQRGAISEALRVLGAPQFVATPRTPEPGAGIESR